MPTSKYCYKFMGERKGKSHADPKRITSLPLKNFALNLDEHRGKFVCYFEYFFSRCILFLLKYRKKLSNCFNSLVASETNFPAV